MAPKAVQDAHDSLVELSRQCSEVHRLLYLNQGEEYLELLMGRIQRGTAFVQRGIATFHDDLKSFTATKALESTKSSDGGTKKPLAMQKIPGLTLVNIDKIPSLALVETDKSPALALVEVDKNPALALVEADKNLALALVEVDKNPALALEEVDKIPSLALIEIDKNPVLALVEVDKNPALASVNAKKIPESTEPPVRHFYHENGRGLNGAYLDPYLSIFLLAHTENPKVRIEHQVEMKGRWLKFPWKLFCGNFPVILKFLNENYRSMKEGGETLVYDTYTTATPKLSYRGVGFNFMFFMESEFAKKQSGYDDVEYFTAYKAFKTLRSLGLSLKQLEGVNEEMSFTEREEMIAMARFLGMSEESIEEKVVEDKLPPVNISGTVSRKMTSKDVSVKKATQEGSDFIAFDDPIESEADEPEGQDITAPSKKAPENQLAGMANKFPHFKHLDRKRKFEE
ncbi:hypothetical protein BGAL_0602g00020 [Botrytis galanthina]|uniref:Uncharacterized protein n=1 Tax=Botrytis galanthina TaxID=278940 RepID=A0A4V4HT92_9HELO|nr:hypothetical protein BGAL_0602g00020 [Botrytis galanthina]